MLKCFVQPFTYWQIKKILKFEYWIDLERVYHYKGNRYGNPNRYILLREDGTLAFPQEVTLDNLREYLTQQGYTTDYE